MPAESSRSSRVLAGHKATSGSDEPSSLTGHAFHLHLHHTSGSEESVSRSFAASQHDRVQRRRINQTAPAPRVYYTVCSYRPTLASAQASASLRERMDAVSASAAATGAVATAAAELVALLRGAVVSPAAGVSRVPPSHQVHTLAQPQLGPREVQAPPYHGGRCGLRAFVRNGVTGHPNRHRQLVRLRPRL